MRPRSRFCGEFGFRSVFVPGRQPRAAFLADPSHGTGRRDKVAPMARAAVAAGADGLLVEVHPDPDHARVDGAQSLGLDQFAELMRQLKMIAGAVGRTI